MSAVIPAYLARMPSRFSATISRVTLRIGSGSSAKLTWLQVYRDSGLKWEKIVSVKPPAGIDAVYSLRITQERRCTAWRDGDFMRFLTIAPDHDSTYGQK